VLTSNSAAHWNPAGFRDYRRLYPGSPDLEALVRADITPELAASFRIHEPPPPLASTLTFILVRGLFGRWIPGHFARPLRMLKQAGLRAIIAKTRAVGTIEHSARAIEKDILERIGPNERCVFLCHSKGGLDALAALQYSGSLRDRTAALVLCQTPRAGCAVLESVLLAAHQSTASTRDVLRERTARAALTLCAAREGCLDITSPRIDRWINRLDAGSSRWPIISIASWSSRPTAWLDSQHARLASIRAQCAHDGLFFTADLIWPVGEQILLPHLDHSQPGVGGGGFDHGRFWLSLARVALTRIENATARA
jgi:hypothetical protein